MPEAMRGGPQAPVRSPSAPPAGSVLPSHHAGCFACGSEHADGLRLAAVAGVGVDVTTRVGVTGAHQGAPGLAHGGLVATILDETLGLVVALRGPVGVTVRLEIDFRAPIPIGRDVVTHGWCTAVERRKVFTAASMHLDDLSGPLVAEAVALFIVVGEEHFAPYAPRSRVAR